MGAKLFDAATAATSATAPPSTGGTTTTEEIGRNRQRLIQAAL